MTVDLTSEERSKLVRTARTVIGDDLRSLTYFDEMALEQLYLRDDLEQSADLVGFAQNERLGFHSQDTYENTELGNYEYTIRVFDRGYLVRTIVGEHGVWVTTDSMPISRFDELASAVQGVLADF